MKKILKIAFLLLFTIFLSSCKSNVADSTKQTGKIVKDCTGTYLQFNNVDYLVCNDELLKDKKEGEILKFSYNALQKCSKRDGKIMCMMYHEHKGVIEIKLTN